MVNNINFTLRLKKILNYYNLSATQLADKIGVQRSSISHLLSGRNKPSLDFVLKLIKHFNDVDLYWLLNGKGKFPKQDGTLGSKNISEDLKSSDLTDRNEEKEQIVSKIKNIISIKDKSIEKIIIFYTDGSFKKYKAD